MRAIRFLMVLMGMALLGTPSKAQADLITSLDQLQVDGTYRWNSLGSTSSQVDNPFLTGGLNGMPGTALYGEALINSGGFSIIQQNFGWGGSFQDGMFGLRIGGDGSYRLSFLDPTTLEYTPVAGFGTFYEDASKGLTSVRFSAYDVNGLLIDSNIFSHTYPNPTITGTAQFGGFLSDQRNIAYIEFDDLRLGASGSGNGFAIGDFHVQRDPIVSPVPEPASIVTMGVGAGVLALGRLLRRRREKAGEQSAAA